MKSFSTKHTLRFAVALAMLLVLLVACGNDATDTADEAGNFQGTITFWAYHYTPEEPSAANPNPPTVFWDVAAEWEALNPGVTIEFLTDLDTPEYLTWLATRMAGGDAPDIFWIHANHIITAAVPSGSAVVLNPFMERPNHYVEGNERWRDLFPDSVIRPKTDVNGDFYTVTGDYVGTAVFYNRELFAQAGVHSPTGFVTWSEYNEINRQLSEAGITPWGFSFGNDEEVFVGWFTRLFNTNFYFDDFYSLAILGEEGVRHINRAESLLGFVNGDFGVDNPQWIAWWELMKYQVDNFMPDGVVSAASTSDTILSQFLNQEIAMMWSGSWQPNTFRDANISFDYGSFPFPYPDPASSPFATAYNSSAAVGGPNAAFQYAVSTQRANSSMTDEKLESVIDWLMFISTPENNSRIVNELGIFIPTMVGAVPLEANAGLIQLLELDSYVLGEDFHMISPAFTSLYFRTFQMFLRGDMTLDEARESMRQMQMDELELAIAELDFDITAYIR